MPRLLRLPARRAPLRLQAASRIYAHLVGQLEFGDRRGRHGLGGPQRTAQFIRENALEDPRMKYFPELEEERFQSMCAVPVPPPRRGDRRDRASHRGTARVQRGRDDFLDTPRRSGRADGQRPPLRADAQARGALEALSRLSEQLAEVNGRDQMCATVTKAAARLLGAASCQLYLLERRPSAGSSWPRRVPVDDRAADAGAAVAAGALILAAVGRAAARAALRSRAAALAAPVSAGRRARRARGGGATAVSRARTTSSCATSPTRSRGARTERPDRAPDRARTPCATCSPPSSSGNVDAAEARARADRPATCAPARARPWRPSPPAEADAQPRGRGRRSPRAWRRGLRRLAQGAMWRSAAASFGRCSRFSRCAHAVAGRAAAIDRRAGRSGARSDAAVGDRATGRRRRAAAALREAERRRCGSPAPDARRRRAGLRATWAPTATWCGWRRGRAARPLFRRGRRARRLRRAAPHSLCRRWSSTSSEPQLVTTQRAARSSSTRTRCASGSSASRRSPASTSPPTTCCRSSWRSSSRGCGARRRATRTRCPDRCSAARSAAADERHLGRHDGHEQDVGVERQARHVEHGVGDVARRPSSARPRSSRRPAGTPSLIRAVISVAALPMSIWPQAMS